VGEHVTAADVFSHRSGLGDHAGDLLEDLGYSGDEIIRRFRFYPLKPFRNNYDYTNYGLTAGAEALATAAGHTWSGFAQRMILGPLGMTSSSFTFADLQRRTDRAALHVKVDGEWRADLTNDVDAQAPAGGASSSVRDMAKWLTMLLARGVYQGEPIIDVAQLMEIWRPQNVIRGADDVGGQASFYGLGWNVNYDVNGELRLSHSGAFGKGAATNITLVPSAKLAIIALTNAFPLGLPEAIAFNFLDTVRYGRPTRDWLAFIGPRINPGPTADQIKYSKPATNPTPSRPLREYVGSYTNAWYGTLRVSVRDGELSFTVGPNRQRFPLLHYSGDDFYFETSGENQTGFSGVIFSGRHRHITSLTVNAWDADKLGTFVRR
jgi:CubicO group peptidase (beta-lactamase class C family)